MRRTLLLGPGAIAVVLSSIVANRGPVKLTDVVTSIEGRDVTGERADDVQTLLDVQVGAKVLLERARGVTVPGTLAPRTPP